MVSNIKHHFITSKTTNYFDFSIKLKHFLDDQVQKLSFNAFPQNVYSSYHKNVLLGMLVDEKEDIPIKYKMRFLTK